MWAAQNEPGELLLARPHLLAEAVGDAYPLVLGCFRVQEELKSWGQPRLRSPQKVAIGSGFTPAICATPSPTRGGKVRRDATEAGHLADHH